MWCKNCRQDVPGIVSPSTPHRVCTRCGMELGEEQLVKPTPAAPMHASGATSATPYESRISSYSSFEDWNIDQSVNELHARLGAWHAADAAPLQAGNRTSTDKQWRLDAAHARPSRPRRPAKPASAPQSVARFIAWLGL